MQRRSFLQTLAGAAAAPLMPAAESRRPNIVFILADDMGFSDLGCYGSEIPTPNLDKLAASGVRFTQFYNTARCCPSRASIFTGLYPHQAGVGHMVADRGVPSYQGYLNDKCVTTAEVLKAAGYRTLMSGKWHVGEERPHWPVDRGFEKYFGLISGSSNYWRLQGVAKMAMDGEPWTPPEKGFYMTDAIADHAVQFLEKETKPGQPFYLHTTFTAPHWPLHAHAQDIEKYRGKYMMGWDELRKRRHARQIELGIVDKRWPMTPRDETSPAWETVQDKKDRDLKMAVYAAQVDRLDYNIGRILAQLKKMNAVENTLVIFMADNGGCAEEINRGTPGVPPGGPDSFFSYGLPWANASNTPFRLYKHWVHEGGIASPFIAAGPGVVSERGKIVKQVGHITDLMPTFVDLAQAKYPSTFQGKPIQPMEGKSLAPVFRGRDIGARKIFWEHEGNRAVREGDMKLVSRHNTNWELYDMVADRTELNDLAGKMPGKAAAMAKDYDAWAQRCGVKKPEELRAAGKKK